MAKPRIEIELTTKGASAVQKALGGVLSSVKSWVGGLGAVVGAAFSVRELTRGLQEAITALDAAGAAAQKAGVGVKDLSTLGYAATISKSNVEQLQVGLKFLNRSIYEAAEGAKEYSAAYNQLGGVGSGMRMGRSGPRAMSCWTSPTGSPRCPTAPRRRRWRCSCSGGRAPS
ncbi:MAG: hypothetical protein M5U12_06750 [Verrucomicrobia bacterium]|nr:hypothetical protein [Verrucomicrobiota bacterium]